MTKCDDTGMRPCSPFFQQVFTKHLLWGWHCGSDETEIASALSKLSAGS